MHDAVLWRGGHCADRIPALRTGATTAAHNRQDAGSDRSSGGRRSWRPWGRPPIRRRSSTSWWPPASTALRLNCSHGTPDELRRRAAEVRAAAERAGRPLGLLFDLQGPKLRLSADPANERLLAVGDEVTFSGAAGAAPTASSASTSPSSRAWSPSARRSSSATACRGSRSQEVLAGQVVARTVAPGRLGPRKGINVTYARPELPVITPKDVEDLAVAAEVGADFVALSFVRYGRRRGGAEAAAGRRGVAARGRSPRSRRSRPTRTSTRSSTPPTGSWSPAATTASRRASRASR